MITPTSDNIILEAEKEARVSKGGIALPETAKEMKDTLTAKVIAVGPKVVGITKGMKVMALSYAVKEIKVGDSEYLLVKEEDVFGILNKI